MKSTFLFVLILIVTNTNVLHASAINQITYAYWDKPDVEIFYITPKKIDKDTQLLFVIHGNSRNAKDLFQHGFHTLVIKILL